MLEAVARAVDHEPPDQRARFRRNYSSLKGVETDPETLH